MCQGGGGPQVCSPAVRLVFLSRKYGRIVKSGGRGSLGGGGREHEEVSVEGSTQEINQTALLSSRLHLIHTSVGDRPSF